MINKNTIIFFLFLFAMLYYISPNDVETNNPVNKDTKNNNNTQNRELVCKNIENIENALHNVLDMVKGLCNKNTQETYTNDLREQFNDKLEREVLAKKYIKRKLKESFKDAVRMNIPKQEINPEPIEHNAMGNSSIGNSSIGNNPMEYSPTSSGFSEYSPDFKDDNILNAY